MVRRIVAKASARYTDYTLPATLFADECLTQLQANLPLRVEPRQALERIYLDSHDWRLYKGGGLLLAKRTQGNYSLIWKDKKSGKPLASVHMADLPRWPAAMPPGHLKDCVSELLQMRALLPLAKVKSQMQVWRVLNEDEKTVARLSLEQPTCFNPSGHNKGELPVRLTLIPVKGYDREAETVRHLLEKKLRLKAARQPLSHDALTRLGRSPGDYSSRFSLQLDPEMRADEAMRRILLPLLTILEANVEGAKADLDSEFLHDLRVATRRTRSALSELNDVLPELVVDDFEQRFAWLGQVTGATRDLDVFILDFAKYRASLPVQMRGDLDPLLPYLQAQQKRAQQALKRKLISPHFRRLLKDWRQYLEGPLARDYLPGDKAALGIKALADRRIWRMYRKVLKEGRTIVDTSPPEALHRLRRNAKKLRYLLEFFQSLYSAKQIKLLVKQLKQLLDNLGDYQDLQTQARQLHGHGEEIQKQKPADLSALLAIGSLIGDLMQRQQAARGDFKQRFAAFDSKQQRALYKALFKSAGVAK